MSKKQVREFIEGLTEFLTDRWFLERSGLNRKNVLMLMNRELWEERLAGIVPIKRRISAKEIFEACEEAMELLGRAPEKGWMKFTYSYATHILYPDEEFTKENKVYAPGAEFYLAVLKYFYDREREVVPYFRLNDFAFLSDEEASKFECAKEYRRFKKYFYEEYVYEMMRLGMEATPFKTLEHIAGVHHVAMTVARGLYEAGIPIDLTLISGAAAGHDMGKFGCKPNEKVPYLHYFYTDQWFGGHDMNYIGHIAANHSTWDLEPENLSVESLVLIYSDFRVKQSRGANGEEITQISSLDDAFNIILSKLDNVDSVKLNRYKFVYSRLHDFEMFMKSLGVDIDLNGHPAPKEVLPDVSLRNAGQTIDSIVYMSVEDNIRVMNRMGAERQFGNLLEAARSEKDWRNVRAYLNVFEEFFTYINDIQKEQTLDFLYELLMHKEGDIRTQAAGLMGHIIARFNAGYRKQIPANMEDVAQEKLMNIWAVRLESMLLPDHKLTVQHKRRIRYQLKNMLLGLVQHAAPAELHDFLAPLADWYRNPQELENGVIFALLDIMHFMPFEKLTDEEMDVLGNFAIYASDSDDTEIRIAAWRSFKMITEFSSELPVCEKIGETAKAYDPGQDYTCLFQKYRVLGNLGIDNSKEGELIHNGEVVADIFLDNLKTGTPWIVKQVNIKLLVDHVEHSSGEHNLHIAAHFSNLIKVSEHVIVRQDAGAALLRIIDQLRPDQINEVVVELLKGLEVGEYQFSKYIPRYLGEAASWLPPAQLEEVVMHLTGLMASSNERIVSVALDTIGVLITCYPQYKERFPEEEGVWEGRRNRLLGIILSGLANYREEVRQEAIHVLGHTVFGPTLKREDKYEIFVLIYKKLLYLFSENKGNELSSFYEASTLTNVCRFITDYKINVGEFSISEREKVAFFPGTFDPFTLSHEEIVKTIRDMGFEVYLAVDEFSWSKKAQPLMIRRQIVNMSIADEFNVNLFPYDIPVNIANPADLGKLKEVFKGREVYMVVGSDVIANASSYRKKPEKNSIHTMNHIAFRRVGDARSDSKYNPEIMKGIKGDLVELELPKKLEDISSSKIRENIDLNRDISNLIDSTVQEYVYNNGFYLREPEYKPVIRARAITFDITENPDKKEIKDLVDSMYEFGDADEADMLYRKLSENIEGKMMILRNNIADNRIVGIGYYSYTQPDELFNVLKDVDLADKVRQKTTGQILLIKGIYVNKDPMIHDAEQLILAELIAESLKEKCCVAIYYSKDGVVPSDVEDAIVRQGFLKQENLKSDAPIYIVDMHYPLVFMQNLEMTLKEPFSSNPRVLKAIYKAHNALQTAMTKLYPGQLVLSLSASVIYHRLVSLITDVNEVPREPLVPRKLGDSMCVPYGKILRGVVIPNTVTKTLHTDRVYEPDLKSFTTEAFKYYAPLESQIKSIKSFNRPVILVDDILHRGGRFAALEPMIKKEKLNIKKVVLGTLSGYGKDTMATKGFDVESVYFIPNLHYWFVESTLYPFIGGDSVRRETMKVAGLTPSINLILPYTVPPLKDCSKEAVFEFSATCIRNSRDILLVLEAEYRALFARNLTLSRLSEAVNLPLCPDKGECVNYDPNLAASVYLENDLQMLYRTKE